MTADHKSESCRSHTAADPATLSSQETTKKVCSCCCTKHTDRSEAERRKLVNRLNIRDGKDETIDELVATLQKLMK